MPPLQPNYQLRGVKPWRCEWRPTDGGPPRVVTLELDLDRVQHFRNLNRSIGERSNWAGCYYDDFFSFWVWEGGREELDAVHRQLAAQYRELHGKDPQPDRAYADFIKRFVAHFPYKHDDRSLGPTEYARFPVELLYDREGDCECLAIFLASLLVRAGFDTAILIGFTRSGRQGAHAATGVALPPQERDATLPAGGVEWRYCEAVSKDPVGRYGFERFATFARHGTAHRISPEFTWQGEPPGWTCPACREGPFPPQVAKCASCQQLPTLAGRQEQGDRAVDWDRTLERFLDWLKWAAAASHPELAAEIGRLHASPIWQLIPSGNRNYLAKALEAARGGESGAAGRYLEGSRAHLLSAWPHVAAAIFCTRPAKDQAREVVHHSIAWLGMSVYEMDNETLAAFTGKMLSDVTTKRVRGFSSGSRLALGRILGSHAEKGDAYLDEKRGSIENILVKTLIPQIFTLVAREAAGKEDGFSGKATGGGDEPVATPPARAATAARPRKA
jgi:hypothetical protein